MIEYALRLLGYYGIQEIIINLHHLGEQIESRLGDGQQLGLRISYSKESELLDTGGGLLADTGLPFAFYPNAVSMNENPFGPTTYMPVAGQPGFNPGSALPTTWRFTSTVPDGGSPVALLALGICGLAVLRRRSGRNVGLLIEKPSA